MSQRFIKVLESLSAPPRAEFLRAAVHSGYFDALELQDLFSEACIDATLTLAIEYIDAGSILVLPSQREPDLKFLAQFAAVRTPCEFSAVALPGKRA